MTRTNPSNSHGQPTLADLMVRFMATRSDAASAAVEPAGGEVEPHEVATGFRVDPRAAWTDAHTGLTAAPVPADWAGLVNQPSPAFAVAMAAGNFPQRVKDVHPLLTRPDPTDLRPTGTDAPVPGLSGLRTWVVREAKKGTPQAALLAAGIARALGEYDWAGELLAAAEGQCTGDLRAAWENERAALLWHRGKCEEALAAWDVMPATPAVAFNRGMALLFLGRPAEARSVLTTAVAALPESSGWNPLARLYLAAAEIRG